MILGFPRFPLHRRNKNTCKKIKHFQWLWASTLPTSPKKLWKCLETNNFWMFLGFPRFPLHPSPKKLWNMCGNPYIFHDSGLPTLPTPRKKSWKKHRNPWFSMILGCPLHWRTHENALKFIHFQWFGLPTLPTQPNTLCKINGNPNILNDSRFPTLAAPLKKFVKNKEIRQFSMILG